MKSRFLLLPLLCLPALGACTSTSGDGYTSDTNAFQTHIDGNLHLDFDNGALVLQAAGRPDARLEANGDLEIDGKSVAVTTTQRDLLKRFYAKVSSVRDDGITIGKAGAAMGVTAVSNAVESLFSDGHHKNDADMQINSKKVSDAALRMCGDITELKSTQAQLAAQMPAIAPYAAFRGEVHCDKSVADTNGAPNTPAPRAQ